MMSQSIFEKQTLTVKDVQEILRIGQVSAYALVRSKVFPVVRIGRAYRIPKEPFFEWIQKSDHCAEVSSIATVDSSCILSKMKNGGLRYGK